MRRTAANVGLPFLTIFLARPAKTFGGFGLVGLVITIPYQSADLGRNQPSGTFTNHYHRTEDITHSGLDYVLCWVITIVLMWLRQALV